MPRYDFRCPSCGLTTERVLTLARYDDPQGCESCGGDMRRLISAPRVNPAWQEYLEENMGQDPVHIRSREHYKQELQKRGLHNQWGVGLESQRWV
jgi:putative FmdB family regulatory protein